MTGYAIKTATGRVASGESDTIFTPRNPRIGRRGCVILHGANRDEQFVGPGTWPNTNLISHAIAAAGIPCIAGDLGGVNTMANDTAVARIDSAWSVLQAASGCASDKVLLVGLSMGGANSIRYAQANPSKVAGIVGFVPGVNLEDVYENNRGGYQTQIGNAWGITYPTPIPARGQTSSPANAALAASIPHLLYYSTADTVVVPATVTAYAALVGTTPIVCDTTNGHADASMAGVPPADVIKFLIANGA